jgi:hypothetical protein
VHAHTQTQINEGVECEYKVGGRRGTVRGLEFKLGKEKVQVMKGKRNMLFSKVGAFFSTPYSTSVYLSELLVAWLSLPVSYSCATSLYSAFQYLTNVHFPLKEEAFSSLP